MESSLAARLGAGTLNLMELGPIPTGAPGATVFFDRCVVIRRHGVCRMTRELVRITDVCRHVSRTGETIVVHFQTARLAPNFYRTYVPRRSGRIDW